MSKKYKFKASKKAIEAAQKLQGNNRDRNLQFLTPPHLTLDEFIDMIGVAFDKFAEEAINDSKCYIDNPYDNPFIFDGD